MRGRERRLGVLGLSELGMGFDLFGFLFDLGVGSLRVWEERWDAYRNSSPLFFLLAIPIHPSCFPETRRKSTFFNTIGRYRSTIHPLHPLAHIEIRCRSLSSVYPPTPTLLWGNTHVLPYFLVSLCPDPSRLVHLALEFILLFFFSCRAFVSWSYVLSTI